MADITDQKRYNKYNEILQNKKRYIKSKEILQNKNKTGIEFAMLIYSFLLQYWIFPFFIDIF